MMSVTPTRDRRAERREATRAEILDAASALMREHGVAGLSLRDLGAKVGMRAQSLYSYFDSKEAIYDALFGQGATELFERFQRIKTTEDPRADLRAGIHLLFDFCLEDHARYQLLFQRPIPEFEPTPESYDPAVATLERSRQTLEAAGGTRSDDLDLMTGIVSGLIDQQISNDPGGERWSRLLDEALDMFFAHLDARNAVPDKGEQA